MGARDEEDFVFSLGSGRGRTSNNKRLDAKLLLLRCFKVQSLVPDIKEKAPPWCA